MNLKLLVPFAVNPQQYSTRSRRHFVAKVVEFGRLLAALDDAVDNLLELGRLLAALDDAVDNLLELDRLLAALDDAVDNLLEPGILLAALDDDVDNRHLGDAFAEKVEEVFS